MSPLRSRSAGMDSTEPSGLEEIGDGAGSRFAELIGLGLAPSLGHRFREIGEEHGEPEPEGDLEDEAGRLVL